MTCAQGLLRLLWRGDPKLECYGTALRSVQYALYAQQIMQLSKIGKHKDSLTFYFHGEIIYQSFVYYLKC